jgi:hypothetical protein
MANELTKIRFLAANYSKLQGLRIIPVGLFVLFTAIWDNAGLQGDLSGLFYSLIGFVLLTWLADRYYVTAFGQVRQTTAQRKRDRILSVASIVLALPAYAFDTAQIWPVSMFGLVFAALFLVMSFWQSGDSANDPSFARYPENLFFALLLVGFSLLALTGFEWWKTFGLQSLEVGMMTVFGTLLVIIGLWGHVRFVRILKLAGTNDHALA